MKRSPSALHSPHEATLLNASRPPTLAPAGDSIKRLFDIRTLASPGDSVTIFGTLFQPHVHAGAPGTAPFEASRGAGGDPERHREVADLDPDFAEHLLRDQHAEQMRSLWG